MSQFDRAYKTSYSTLIETVRLILYRFRDIASYLSKVADFNPPHLHLAPRGGFRKLESLGCCVVLFVGAYDPSFSHFSRTPTFDRQTDRGP